MKFLLAVFLLISSAHALTVKERMDALSFEDFKKGATSCLNKKLIAKPNVRIFRFDEYARSVVNKNDVSVIDCIENQIPVANQEEVEFSANRLKGKEARKFFKSFDCSSLPMSYDQHVCYLLKER